MGAHQAVGPHRVREAQIGYFSFNAVGPAVWVMHAWLLLIVPPGHG
jgi:hypothetical protein